MLQISETRTFCGHIKEVDADITKQIIHRLGPKEKRVYSHIATGAFWNEDQLANINNTDGMCKHCGNKVHSSSHVLWECPSINKHRRITALNQLDHKALPLCVQNGIPPAMHKSFSNTFWESTDEGTKVFESKSSHYIGIPKDTKQQNLALNSDLAMSSAIGQSIHKDSITYARQAFQIIKNGTQDIVMPLPHSCSLTAPTEINVYTDGSWINATKQFIGIGGAGVWWPHRTLSKDYTDSLHLHLPISNAENQIAVYHATLKGVRLYTKIGGYCGSSTRSELAAGIIALCADGPIHVGSDSEVFVNTANGILEDIRHNRAPYKQWKLIGDGDLWEHFYCAAKAKGPNSIRLTWVKGHATQYHIDKGISTQKHKAGKMKLTSLLISALPCTGKKSL